MTQPVDNFAQPVDNSGAAKRKRRKVVDNFSDLIVSRDTLAEVLGVAPESVSRLVQAFGMPKAGHGKYHLPTTVQWMIERAGKTSNEARTNLYIAQTEKTELDVAIAKHQHVPFSEVQHLMLEHLNILITACDGLPQRVAAGVLQCGTIGEAVALIRENTYAARDDLASAIESVRGGAVTASGSSETSAAAKRGNLGKRRAPRTADKPAAGEVAK